MKNTLIFSLAIAIVAVSLFVYGCGPAAQAPEKKAPATSEPVAPPASTVSPLTPPAAVAPSPAAAEQASAQPVPESVPDSDFSVNPGPAESNPADLPEPSAP